MDANDLLYLHSMLTATIRDLETSNEQLKAVVESQAKRLNDLQGGEDKIDETAKEVAP